MSDIRSIVPLPFYWIRIIEACFYKASIACMLRNTTLHLQWLHHALFKVSVSIWFEDIMNLIEVIFGETSTHFISCLYWKPAELSQNVAILLFTRAVPHD